jgi:uncharacterized membrane protein HdeD (DUF308 family)
VSWRGCPGGDNSGSWTGPVNSFLRISPDGHVRHLDWKEGRAIEHGAPVVLSDAKPDRAPSAAKNPFSAAVSSVRTFFPKAQKRERSRWVLVLQGTLAIAVGVGAVVVSVGEGSSAGLRLLASAFGCFALLDGALSLWGASREQPVKRLLYRARGGASLLLGLVVLRHRAAVELFMILVGVWAFLAGALGVAASAVFQRMLESTWLPSLRTYAPRGGGGAHRHYPAARRGDAKSWLSASRIGLWRKWPSSRYSRLKAVPPPYLLSSCGSSMR